jgi:Tfp pilus assembly protein PilF
VSRLRACLAACAFAAAPGTAVTEESKTVIGPSNVALADGAAALMAGDAEEGVRLTHRGLQSATSRRDRVAGWSNLCAGYVSLRQLNAALRYCNDAVAADPDNWRALSNRALVYMLGGKLELATADIGRAESIAPESRTVRQVRVMLQDAIAESR